jgi:hypothetical protein
LQAPRAKLSGAAANQPQMCAHKSSFIFVLIVDLSVKKVCFCDGDY